MKRESNGARELRVGVFLALCLVLCAVAIFAIGQKSGVFEGKTTLYAYFEDVSGLVPGAAVRLSGLDVGSVSSIEFPEQLERRTARVAVSVKSRYMPRVRGDSVAMIDSKGLLGDKIINISLGTPSAPQLRDGAVLKSRKAAGFDDLAEKLDEAVSSITAITSSIATVPVQRDIGRIVASTANILHEIEHGRGFAHRFFYDPVYGARFEALLTDSQALVGQLRKTAGRVDRTAAALERGDSILHELIYGEEGKATFTELRSTAASIQAITEEVRNGDGLVNALVYGDQGTRALTELDQAAARINRMTAEMERGQGTLGGLIVDPSVYEDLKTVLGNVERNVLFKALVRFTIKRGDIERPANIKAQPLEK